jgi:hypothetical protein
MKYLAWRQNVSCRPTYSLMDSEEVKDNRLFMLEDEMKTAGQSGWGEVHSPSTENICVLIQTSFLS